MGCHSNTAQTWTAARPQIRNLYLRLPFPQGQLLTNKESALDPCLPPYKLSMDSYIIQGNCRTVVTASCFLDYLHTLRQ